VAWQSAKHRETMPGSFIFHIFFNNIKLNFDILSLVMHRTL
jgi:hypothetical protein